MALKERIIELLKAGVPSQQVADAVGCDISYVSQVKADPETAAVIAEAQLATIEEDIEHDDMLERAEMKALKAIEQRLGHANFAQALAAYKVLNSANRRNNRGVAAGGNTTNIGVQVTLTLPSTALPNYVKNANNEIIEVEGRTMTTANVSHIDAMLKRRADEKLANSPRLPDIQKAANLLENLHQPAKDKVPAQRATKLPSVLTVDML